jgi:hypothetical protein
MASINKQPLTWDAVVVVPGIMGSELVDVTNGRPLWGLADPRWYVSAWTSGASMRALKLTEDERAGRYGRVRAARLLRFPAFAPLLAGFEPYSRLLKAVREVVPHSDAVAEFAYDWRLPVAYNANLLAEFSRRHLAAWRSHAAHTNAGHSGLMEAGSPRLVLVTHSTGGLLARELAMIPGIAEEIRATITLGTPFYGAPKAVQLLASGTGSPLLMPRARLRALAGGLPGLHDLLPVYRCVTDSKPSENSAASSAHLSAVHGARRLTPSDVVDLGGDAELAKASFAWHEQIAAVSPINHVQVVGSKQPTVQALTIDAGTVIGHRYTLQPARGAEGTAAHVDQSGDGTVPRQSAQLPGLSAMPLAQSHGALAATGEATLIVQDVLTDRRTGPWQGAGDLGLDIPDIVGAGHPFQAVISGAEQPTDVACRVFDVAVGRQVDAPRIEMADGRLIAAIEPQGAGLYRVRIDGSGGTPVSQLVLVTPLTDVDDDEVLRGRSRDL